jgi:two-component system chemotaxis response regulator CheB
VTIRVLVVDDSAFMRRVISEAIAAEPDMEVAGVAINGLDALLKVEQVQPDVLTLDVEMPDMDGLTALRHLMARYPRPVVMLSSLTQAGAATTIRALTLGAVDFVSKPSGPISLDFHRVREELVQKIRVAATAKVRGPRAGVREERDPGRRTSHPAPARSATNSAPWDRLVVIGASTGGPRALSTLLPDLPATGSAAYLIVQHMPAGFTHSLAERLDTLTPLHVREAVNGDRLSADTVLVARGNYHLRLNGSGVVELDQGPRVHGVRPSVDVALHSVAHAFGNRTVTVILTGMGLDGAAGAASVRAAGGCVLAEDESSCVVWGMPRAVVERAGADQVVPLDGMARTITTVLAQPELARSVA